MAFIMMVVAQDTDYVFLDEPPNNLDIKHSVETNTDVVAEIHELH